MRVGQATENVDFGEGKVPEPCSGLPVPDRAFMLLILILLLIPV
jgi:hypothetical protein